MFWAASDVGWVVGHSYIVYAPLLHGCTTILFEGKPVGTPDAGTFWRVISEHGVVALFTAPTAFRAIKKEDPDGDVRAAIRSVEIPHAVPRRRARRPRDDEMGGGEAGRAGHRPLVADRDRLRRSTQNPVGLGMLPVKYGSPGVPMPGYDVRVLDDAGHAGDARRRSATSSSNCRCRRAACRRCGMPTSDFAKPISTEFPGYYKTADAGFIDEDGYLYIMARTDDIINVAGHRLSTGGMEEVLAEHPDVAECAVIGIADTLKGQVPCGFVVLNAGVIARPLEIESEVVALVRDRIGAGRGVQDRDHGQAPAQDALRQDLARHDAEDRRPRGMDHARDDRRPGDPG